MILPAGSPLHALTDRPALVVFLRSFGCTFSREAIGDLAAARAEIEAAGASIVFVHGGTREKAEAWFAKYGMSGRQATPISRMSFTISPSAAARRC